MTTQRMCKDSRRRALAAGSYGNSLPEIEARLQKIVRAIFIDRDRFVRGGVYAKTLLPYTPKDVAHIRVQDMYHVNGAIPYSWKKLIMNYEDADMATGDYLISQVHKYRVTGARMDLADARATFNAVLALCDRAARTHRYGRGWLPKPHNGIRDVREACETSVDQYTKIALALDLYRREIATRAERKRAGDILVAFADWWIEHNYTTGYFGYCCWWYRLGYPHATSFFLYILALAESLTGRGKYRVEFDKMMAYQKNLYCHKKFEPNAANLTIENLERLYDLKPWHRRLWLRGIRACWKWSRDSLTLEGQGTRHLPLLHGGRVLIRFNVGTRVAASAVAAAKFLPNRSALLDQARWLLLKYNHHDMFRQFHPSNAKLPVQFAYCQDVFASGICTAWLQTYWQIGLPKERSNDSCHKTSPSDL